MADGPRYRVRPVMKPLPSHAGMGARGKGRSTCAHDTSVLADPDARSFVRPETEDDDGYDPFSDRPAAPEPQFQKDPWN
ncbi:hypothetical protein B5F40_09250 [Gordonibacter sp. An230]|uniref:hypothetical protein n=1 Tax=Gordonibacter sp. An230 TaxID=1965592 RepID=UPI000B38BEF0|nr:hypothetical protein [Gordonibacter sp. An230]OUO89855.1 hypothetical protein B5F40_09250 [Gordonibacter sp. An230]